MPLWNRSPAWPGGGQPNPFAVPSDPAVSDPASPDPYRDGQYLPVIAPVPTRPEQDQIRADVYVPPYTGPNDLDDYGRETPEMRRAYRDFHRKEPAVRSAVDGKAAAVAALDLSVMPRDKDRPDDVAAAKWVKECLDDTPHGTDGLILNILRPAFVDGFSVNEKTLHGVMTPAGPRAGLAHVKNKDTEHLQLRLDAYRNVLGVVNTVRGLRTHDPRKVILFTHADMFDNPFGQSDLRATYRSANLINDAYQLWHVAMKVFSMPFLKGTVKDDVRRKQMEAALKAARAAGWITFPEGDDVEVLNLATATSYDAFEKKVRILREEIFLTVRNAYTPFMQGSSSGETRNSTATSKHAGSDPVEYLLAKAVGRCLTFQLVPDLVVPNFPPGTGIPRVILGGVNWGETEQQVKVAALIQKEFGLKPSAKWIYEISQVPPSNPNDPSDIPPGPTPPGGPPAGLSGLPTGPAGPTGPPTPSGAGNPPPTPAPATPPAASGSPFPSESAAQFAQYFAPGSHGHYPGDMHEQFGMTVSAFAQATQLLRKQVRVRGVGPAWVWAKRGVHFAAPGPPPRPGLVWNEGTHRWVNPQTGEEHEHPPAHVSPPTHEIQAVPPEHAPAVGTAAAGVVEDLAKEFPEAAKDPGLWGKVTGLAQAAAERVAVYLFRAQEQVQKVGAVLDAAFTTPEDMRTNGFINPSGSSGVAGHETPDAFKEATGIPGQIGAKLLAAVAVKGWALVKSLLGKSHAADVNDLDLAAELLAGVIDAIQDGTGLPRADVAAVWAKLADLTAPPG